MTDQSQFQVINLVARIATSPTLQVRGETTVATLRVAVQRPKRNGTDQGTDFFDVTVFGRAAETAVRYLDVGRRVAICGRLRHQTWQTDDGQRRQKVDIVAHPYGIQFLNGARRDDDSDPDVSDFEPVPAADDDIPF